MSAQASFIKSIIEALLSAGIELAKEYGPQLWETIFSYWGHGKKTLAVIGPTACGKDSLIARLQGKPVPDIHINTGMPEDVAEYKVEYPVEGDRKFPLLPTSHAMLAAKNLTETNTGRMSAKMQMLSFICLMHRRFMPPLLQP